MRLGQLQCEKAPPRRPRPPEPAPLRDHSGRSGSRSRQEGRGPCSRASRATSGSKPTCGSRFQSGPPTRVGWARGGEAAPCGALRAEPRAGPSGRGRASRTRRVARGAGRPGPGVVPVPGAGPRAGRADDRRAAGRHRGEVRRVGRRGPRGVAPDRGVRRVGSSPPHLVPRGDGAPGAPTGSRVPAAGRRGRKRIRRPRRCPTAPDGRGPARRADGTPPGVRPSVTRPDERRGRAPRGRAR